ncbi:MAG: DnaA regulatory inactivator HdaA [Rhizobiaceae bacterium]
MRKARQLPLDLGHRQGSSRDDLVVTTANAEAVALIDRWPDWPAPVMVLAGPSGSGKTHLGEIWREVSGAAAVSPRELGEAAAAAAGEGPVLVDDADSRPLDEAGLFHLINAARSAGNHLLLTSRRFPAAWGVRLPDLQSRLKAAATVEIREPDELLLTGVVTKLFADRQVEVEPHVVSFVVRRIERSLSTAIAVVARLDAAALEQKSRITRALAAETLGALDRRQGELDF